MGISTSELCPILRHILMILFSILEDVLCNMAKLKKVLLYNLPEYVGKLSHGFTESSVYRLSFKFGKCSLSNLRHWQSPQCHKLCNSITVELQGWALGNQIPWNSAHSPDEEEGKFNEYTLIEFCWYNKSCLGELVLLGNPVDHNRDFRRVSQSITKKKKNFGQKVCTIWETREVRSGVFIRV